MPVRSTRLVIIGGGPAGNQAATSAARLGADVTLVEREVVGGAAHLWDCIPSKTMIATGNALSFAQRSRGMGLAELSATVDVDGLKARIAAIEEHLHRSVVELLTSQGVRMLAGAGRLVDAHTVAVDGPDGTELVPADAILLSTG